MRNIARIVVAVASLGTVVACGKKAPDDDKTGKPTVVTGTPSATGGPSGATGGAAPAPVPTAAGGEVTSAPNVTDCPKSLEGSESVNRVITKACGVVPVTGAYHINNGTLTLEAGATLAFKDGGTLNIGYNDGAKLIVKGTAEAPVTFTALGDKVPGVWAGVNLYSHADRSSIDHLIIEYAGDEANEAVKIEAQDIVWTNSTVRSSKGVGVRLVGSGSFKQFAGNVFEATGKAPLILSPTAVGGLGGGNKFPDGAVVEVYGGSISGQVKWSNPGAPIFVEETVHVNGEAGARATLEIAAGVEVRMGADAALAIGYNAPAALKISGTAAAPVVFTTNGEKKPGAWSSVQVYGNGEATVEGATFEYGGTADGDGALHIADGTLSLKGSTFRNNALGVSMVGRAKVKLFDGNTFEKNTKAAIALAPQQLGSLGGANVYDDASKIELAGGTVDETATWVTQNAAIECTENWSVDGRTVLTINAGARFVMKDGINIQIGYNDNASLRLMGTADKPIKFSGLRDEAGSWANLTLQSASRDSIIQNVIFRDAGGDGGIVVASTANAKISDVTCQKCAAAALAYQCDSKVTAANIKGEEGTPKGEAKPECN